MLSQMNYTNKVVDVGKEPRLDVEVGETCKIVWVGVEAVSLQRNVSRLDTTHLRDLLQTFVGTPNLQVGPSQDGRSCCCRRVSPSPTVSVHDRPISSRRS